MIISIASGKGGTGKTTVATNLALSLGGDVNLLDCDVEEPNAHLFIKPTIDKVEPVTTFVPEIDHAKCNLCRKCTDICRFSALAIAGKSVLLFPEMCHSCEGCMEVCPEGAISPSMRELGVMESGTCGDLGFYAGRMRVGEAMSPPLIKKVRTKERERDITIIDAPPGTSCPVIAAMKGVDLVLMVTEPTPFALSDMKMVVELLREENIPFGVVVNKSGIGNRDIYTYLENESIELLENIPWTKERAQLYSRGSLIIDEDPIFKDKMKNILNKVLGENHG